MTGDGPATDEFDDYLREQMRDPVFRAAYEVAERRAGRSGWYDGPLGGHGREPGFPVCSPWPADQRSDGGGIKPVY